jgi:hypothetical protein
MKRLDLWGFRPGKSNAGGVVGRRGIFPSTIFPDAVERPVFPPLDHAWVKAIACESVAQSQQPLSRQSLSDLARRIHEQIGRPMSRSTICRILHNDAIKPWQHESWIFPCDPDFGVKAARILDLYAGRWRGRPLRDRDVVLSCDEKTSIQARCRRHEETPPRSKQRRRVEHTYDRKGALQYLAAWDVRRGRVLGRCEAKTGIEPFGRLVDQILHDPTYEKAKRIFLVVDNGSSHRGAASIQRMAAHDSRILLVHTPIHASWLNQVEIYFSMVQRKVLTPNDYPNLQVLEQRLGLYEELTNRTPKPFDWKFTRKKLYRWLKRSKPHFSKAATADAEDD